MPVSKAPARVKAAPAAIAVQPPNPAEPAPAKPTSLFDAPEPAESEDDSIDGEGYTAELEENEELDEAA